MFNLPNKITLSRLLLSFVFFALVLSDQTETLDWALVIFIVACSTDFLDGYFARKMNLVTAFGRIADPFVDKVIVCGGFALMLGHDMLKLHPEINPPVIQSWMVVVMICREFLVSSIRGYAESKEIPFGAELAGKIKAFVQMFALGFAIYYYAHGKLPYLAAEPSRYITVTLVYAAVILTVLSSINYILRARRIFSEM